MTQTPTDFARLVTLHQGVNVMSEVPADEQHLRQTINASSSPTSLSLTLSHQGKTSILILPAAKSTTFQLKSQCNQPAAEGLPHPVMSVKTWLLSKCISHPAPTKWLQQVTKWPASDIPERRMAWLPSTQPPLTFQEAERKREDEGATWICIIRGL